MKRDLSKIAIALIGGPNVTLLAAQHIKEQFGEDVEVITVEEAIERKLKPEDICNLPTMKIKPTEVFEMNTLTLRVADEHFGRSSTGKGGRARNKSKFKKWSK